VLTNGWAALSPTSRATAEKHKINTAPATNMPRLQSNKDCRRTWGGATHAPKHAKNCRAPKTADERGAVQHTPRSMPRIAEHRRLQRPNVHCMRIKKIPPSRPPPNAGVPQEERGRRGTLPAPHGAPACAMYARLR
jgi:hypothetical protein